MTLLKRLLCIVLCCCISFGLLAACGGAPDGKATVQPTAEISRAVSTGIMPEEWQSDLNKTITFKRYTQVLLEIVERWNPDMLGQWQNITALAAESEEPMEREDGLLMLSYLWILMGHGSEYLSFPVENPETHEKFYTNHWEEKIYNDRSYEIQINSLSCDYPYFPDWKDKVYHSLYDTNYIFGAVWVFPFIKSPVSNEALVSLDENDSLNLREPLSIADAVTMALRMAEYCRIELRDDWREYVHVTETGSYNRDIISDELLNSLSELPEVSQSLFPSEWKGAGICARKDYAEEYMHFEESDIAFLHENGFNFTRLFFHFQTLRYPDYPKDPYLINKKELEELDQLLAWCIEYGVHLQIAMRGYLDENGVNEKDSPQHMPENDAAWALTQAYWEMLTERYAGIDSKYLSFDLCNEIQPEPHEIELHKTKLGEMVEKMRSIDPDRVLLYSLWNMGRLEWAEAFASLGIGVGCHSYQHTFITSGDKNYMQMNPYAQPTWPQPYFPSGKIMGGEIPLEISGDIGGAEMRIHIWYSDENPSLGIYSEGRLLESINAEGIQGESGDYFYYDRIYSLPIPEDVEKIELRVDQGWARIDTIIFEKNGIVTNMMPCDTLGLPDYTEPLAMIVHGDGSYSNSENLVYDAERIYSTSIEPYQRIAQQYGVGFIVNEFGMAGVDVHWDIDTVTAFHTTYLEMLEEKKLPWCYCEMANVFPKHLLLLFHEQSQWANATEEDITYTLSDGSEVTLRVCKELLDLFREYTMK